jgi:hypothetical protein
MRLKKSKNTKYKRVKSCDVNPDEPKDSNVKVIDFASYDAKKLYGNKSDKDVSNKHFYNSQEHLNSLE